MLGTDRHNQSGIFKNVKKFGWIFTSIAFVIALIGIGLLIKYSLDLKSGTAQDYVQAIATAIKSENESLGNIQKNLRVASVAIKELTNNYIHKISISISVICAGIICFICMYRKES